MKQFLLQCTTLVLISFSLSSCYYASPVPLASEGRLPEKGLQGSWKMLVDEDSDETYTLKLYDKQDKEGYNGDLIVEGIEDGKKTVDFFRLTVFVTQVKGVGIVNIGLNTGDPDGEYLFGKYIWDGDQLQVFYVSEEGFKNITGDISYFTNSEILKERFEQLLAKGDLFDKEPVVFLKAD